MLGPPLATHLQTRIPALLILPMEPGTGPSIGDRIRTVHLVSRDASVGSWWSFQSILRVSDGRTHPTHHPNHRRSENLTPHAEGAFASISSRRTWRWASECRTTTGAGGPMHTSGPFPEQRHSTLRCRRSNLQHNALRCFGSRRMQTPMERISHPASTCQRVSRLRCP